MTCRPSYRIRLGVMLFMAASSLAVAACGKPAPSTDSSTSTASTTPEGSIPAAAAPAGPIGAASAGSSAIPTELAGLLATCGKDKLPLKHPGQLTIGTDKPGHPPYIIDGDPTSGQGFESALAYAVAEKLGFSRDEVKWSVVPLNASYAPGPKDFDFDINQIGITPDRLQAVDFSNPYYHAPQAIVTLASSKIATATTLAELAPAKLGVQIGTTTLDAVKAVIQPRTELQVFDDAAAATAALKNGNIDGLAASLPTAIHLRDAELEQAKVLGTFSAEQGDNWGLLFEKGSPLVRCVNEALSAVKSTGQLEQITHDWMEASADAPELE